LSEMLDPKKVSKITLVDKMWPRHDSKEIKKTHLNPDHLYHEDWPIRLARSSQNLKQGGDRRNMTKRLISPAAGPILLLGVHLCGTLSLRAVELFNANEGITSLSLKPCCLPVPGHSYRKEIWTLGGHRIFARKVCGMGKWKGGKWIGPPRKTLEGRFKLWCQGLAEGTDIGEQGEKSSADIKVQAEHFQNTFIWATRPNGVGGNKPALSTNYVEQGTGYNPKPVPETAAAAEAVALAAELRAPAAAAGVAAAAVPDLTTSPTPAPIVSVVAESAALPAARKCCQGSCSQCA